VTSDAPEPAASLLLDLALDEPTPALVRELLREVIDTELGLDIVELGLLRAVDVEDGVARVRFTVTAPACPPYRGAFYVPLGLLHAGLVVRLLGDAAGDLTAWRWGGVLNELAILGFLAVAAHTAVRAGRRPR
jgi:hypothetical protein